MSRLFSLLLISFSLISSASFAQNASLKQNMKAIDKLVKAIKLTVADPAQNTNNTGLASQIAPLFQAALQQMPDMIGDLPADQQARAVEGYHHMIQQEIEMAQNLQAAFQANDNAQAGVVLKKMLELKSDGHDQFDP
jgi:hypothetical protein